MSAAKKLSTEKDQKEDMLWKEAKEVMRLGRVYGLLDGTVCSTRDQASVANQELSKEYSNGH